MRVGHVLRILIDTLENSGRSILGFRGILLACRAFRAVHEVGAEVGAEWYMAVDYRIAYLMETLRQETQAGQRGRRRFLKMLEDDSEDVFIEIHVEIHVGSRSGLGGCVGEMGWKMKDGWCKRRGRPSR